MDGKHPEGSLKFGKQDEAEEKLKDITPAVQLIDRLQGKALEAFHDKLVPAHIRRRAALARRAAQPIRGPGE